jgi:hypothetical protein
MPQLQSIVRDLCVNRSAGIGRRPHGNFEIAQESRTLNEFCRVRQAASAARFSYGDVPDNRLNVDLADNIMDLAPNLFEYRTANGFYLYYIEGWSTVATLSRARFTVAAPDFSGCLYSVYNAGNGEYVCVHTSRPNNEYREAFVTGIRSYAGRMRWKLLYELPTAGLIGKNGCTSVCFVSQVDYTVEPEPVVWTARLQLDQRGLSVARDSWH